MMDLNEAAMDKFIALAKESSCTPRLINRFVIIPTGPDSSIISFGGVGMATEKDGTTTILANVVISLTLPRAVAEDLGMMLEDVCGVTEEAKAKARGRLNATPNQPTRN